MAEFNYDSILSQDEIDAIIGDRPNEEEIPTREEEQEEPDLYVEDSEDSEDAEEVEDAEYEESEETDDEEEEEEDEEEEDYEEGEDTDYDEADTSPDDSIFPKLAAALRDSGVFPDLTDIEYIDSAEAFNDMIEDQVNQRLSATQYRIKAALDAGINPDQIKDLEYTIQNLSSITDANLEDESEQGENLRKGLIYRDLVNKGFTHERALKSAERAIANGTDIEEAREALDSNLNFYKSAYQYEIQSRQIEQQKFIANEKEKQQQLHDAIMNSEEIFPGLDVDKNTRRRVYDFMVTPIVQDSKTGQYYTEFQWELQANPISFMKNIGLVYTLTNGFQSLDKLIGKQVNKATKRAYRELEEKINSSRRSPNGRLKFINGDDSEASYKNYTFL